MAEQDTSSDRRRNHVVAARQLARRYEKARKAAGLTQTQAAKALGWSMRKQQLLEYGDQSVSDRDLDVIVPTLGIPPEDEPHWRELVKLARTKAWWDAYGEEDLPAEAKLYVGLEQGSTRQRSFAPLLIHSLMQTDRYRAALLAGAAMNPRPVEKVAAMTRINRRRREVLTGPDPLEAWAVIDEAALHRVPGTVEVMAEQLAHLAELGGTHDNVTIQIVPARAGMHPGLHGAFILTEFDWSPEPEFVYTESVGERPAYLNSRRDIYAFSAVFDRLAAIALSPEDSLQMLSELADRVA